MEGNSSSRKAVLWIVVVFVLGVALGVLGSRVALQRGWGGRWLMPRRAEMHQRVMDDMSRQVGLTPDQRKQVEGILDEARAKSRAISEQTRPQIEQLRQQTRDRIRGILTDEQKPKFEEFVRRMDEERRKRSE